MNLQRSYFGVYHPLHKLSLLVCDLFCIGFSFHFATSNRLNTNPDFLSFEYIALNIILVTSLFIGGAYTSSKLASKPKLPLRTFFTVLAAIFPIMLLIYLLGPDRFTYLFGRGVFPVALVIFGVLAVITRYFINNFYRQDSLTQNVLILGQSSAQQRIDTTLAVSPLSVNVFHTQKLDRQELEDLNLHSIVISPDSILADEEQEILINFRLAGVPIFSLSDFFENFLFLVPVQEINNEWFIRTQGFSMLHSTIAATVKRLIDVLFTLLLIIITLPVFAVTAILIKLSSLGPIFFSQTRVGFKGETFTIYKFRTMHVGAEKEGAKWACDDDPRIIPFGNFLRKFRIDELPQCWNILKGDMSIIGPRPERPEFTSMLVKEIPYYELRNIVKPGLTGWAQVKYPYGASVQDALRKLQFDLYYIKNQSLLLDLNILMRTMITVLQRAGR